MRNFEKEFRKFQESAERIIIESVKKSFVFSFFEKNLDFCLNRSNTYFNSNIDKDLSEFIVEVKIFSDASMNSLDASAFTSNVIDVYVKFDQLANQFFDYYFNNRIDGGSLALYLELSTFAHRTIPEKIDDKTLLMLRSNSLLRSECFPDILKLEYPEIKESDSGLFIMPENISSKKERERYRRHKYHFHAIKYGLSQIERQLSLDLSSSDLVEHYQAMVSKKLDSFFLDIPSEKSNKSDLYELNQYLENILSLSDRVERLAFFQYRKGQFLELWDETCDLVVNQKKVVSVSEGDEKENNKTLTKKIRWPSNEVRTELGGFFPDFDEVEGEVKLGSRDRKQSFLAIAKVLIEMAESKDEKSADIVRLFENTIYKNDPFVRCLINFLNVILLVKERKDIGEIEKSLDAFKADQNHVVQIMGPDRAFFDSRKRQWVSNLIERLILGKDNDRVIVQTLVKLKESFSDKNTQDMTQWMFSSVRKALLSSDEKSEFSPKELLELAKKAEALYGSDSNTAERDSLFSALKSELPKCDAEKRKLIFEGLKLVSSLISEQARSEVLALSAQYESQEDQEGKKRRSDLKAVFSKTSKGKTYEDCLISELNKILSCQIGEVTGRIKEIETSAIKSAGPKATSKVKLLFTVGSLNIRVQMLLQAPIFSEAYIDEILKFNDIALVGSDFDLNLVQETAKNLQMLCERMLKNSDQEEKAFELLKVITDLTKPDDISFFFSFALKANLAISIRVVDSIKNQETFSDLKPIHELINHYLKSYTDESLDLDLQGEVILQTRKLVNILKVSEYEKKLQNWHDDVVTKRKMLHALANQSADSKAEDEDFPPLPYRPKPVKKEEPVAQPAVTPPVAPSFNFDDFAKPFSNQNLPSMSVVRDYLEQKQKLASTKWPGIMLSDSNSNRSVNAGYQGDLNDFSVSGGDVRDFSDLSLLGPDTEVVSHGQVQSSAGHPDSLFAVVNSKASAETVNQQPKLNPHAAEFVPGKK